MYIEIHNIFIFPAIVCMYQDAEYFSVKQYNTQLIGIGKAFLVYFAETEAMNDSSDGARTFQGELFVILCFQ